MQISVTPFLPVANKLVLMKKSERRKEISTKTVETSLKVKDREKTKDVLIGNPCPRSLNGQVPFVMNWRESLWMRLGILR